MECVPVSEILETWEFLRELKLGEKRAVAEISVGKRLPLSSQIV